MTDWRVEEGRNTNWEVAATVAEMVGALTVVITLIYLAVQIRQNRIAVETSTQATMAEGCNAINVAIPNSQEVAEIFENGFNDPNSLTSTQRARCLVLGQAYLNHFTLEKKLADSGAVPPDQWGAHAGHFTRNILTAGGQYILENVAFSPDILPVFEEFKDWQPPDVSFDADAQ